MPETAARLRYFRASPFKVRQVLDLIRGQDVVAARDTLRLCERGAARDVRKLLDSAVANAEHNDHIAEDELYVARAFADEGPTLKRWRPRARGRGTRIRKRTSHVTIVVARLDDEELARRRRLEAQAAPTRRRPTRRRARPAAAPARGTPGTEAPEVQAGEPEAMGTDATATEPVAPEAVGTDATATEPVAPGAASEDEAGDDAVDEASEETE